MLRSRDWKGVGPLLLGAVVVFALVAPFTVDSHNTILNRAFLDLLTRGNPYSLAPAETVQAGGSDWRLDWPYPPPAIALAAPAWLAYRMTGSEALYQLLFKLPIAGCVLIAATLLYRLAPAHSARSTTARLLFNPGVLLLAVVSGGYDAILLAPLLGTYCCLLTPSRTRAGAVCLGLAIGLRLYPLVALPALCIWLWRDRGFRAAGRFAVVTLATTAFCLAPVLLDLSGYLAASWGLQVLGPFSPAVILNALLHKLLGVWPASPLAGSRPEWIAYTIASLLTLLALATVYRVIARRDLALLPVMLAPFLVFYALHPRMHALYVVGMLSLGLLAPSGLVKRVWIPGVIWYLLFNGDFGATGLPYFVAPWTGAWLDTYQLLGLPPGRWHELIWWGLIAGHSGLLLVATRTLLSSSPTQPALRPIPVDEPRLDLTAASPP